MNYEQIINVIAEEIKTGMAATYNATHEGEIKVFFDKDLEDDILSQLEDFSPDEDSEISDRLITIEDLEVAEHCSDRDIVLYDRETGEGVVFLTIEDVDGGYLVRDSYHKR